MNSHITVLKKEAVAALAIQTHDTIVDATLGSLGHAHEILAKLGHGGALIGTDADPAAVAHAEEALTKEGVQTCFQVANFRNIHEVIARCGYTQVDGILADLGWRMEQFTESGKGFSFKGDEPLLMTYGDPDNYPFTARDIVNEWDVRDIRNVLKGYAEEQFAQRIAHAIAEARTHAPIETTAELVRIVENAVPERAKRHTIHPATRTFQALRIAVNDELSALEDFLKEAVGVLSNGGRLAVISFHSLEDRIVKHAFRDFAQHGLGIVCTKKPIYPTPEEKHHNTRSRSAKLRIFEKHATT